MCLRSIIRKLTTCTTNLRYKCKKEMNKYG